MLLSSCGQQFVLVNILWNRSSCYLAANPLCVLLLWAVLGLPVEFAERRSCCHGNFESCHCFPLCQQLWRSRAHWSKFFLGWNCSAVLRCLADVEADTAAEVHKKGEASFPLPKPLAELKSNRADLEINDCWDYWAILFLSQGLCFSSSLQEEIFKGVLYCYKNRKMWKWKTFVKVSLSRVLGWHLCLSEVPLSCCFVIPDEETYLEGTRQFWFIVLFTCNFFFGSSTCSIPLWAILL